jgi:hypothetical protein
MVDGRGFEPPTSALRTPRSPTELTAHCVPIKENQLINLPFFIGFFHSPQLEKQILLESKM